MTTPTSAPPRDHYEPSFAWLIESALTDPYGSVRVPIVRAVRMATGCGLKPALDATNQFFDLIRDLKNLEPIDQIGPDPDTIDVSAELADLDETERACLND